MAASLADRLYNAANFVKLSLQAYAPVDTGNMALNSIRVEQRGPYDFVVIVGGEPAPYAPATNQPWTSPRWNGRKNPNEGWVNDCLRSISSTIKSMMEGRISQEEIIRMNTALQIQVDIRTAEMQARRLEE